MRKFNLRNLLMAAAIVAASSFTGCNTEDVDYDTPYLKLSESSKTFDSSQSSYEFTVESNRPWKVTAEKDAQGVVPDWLRAQPDHGDGNGKFTVTVLALEGVDRQATLKVSTATVWEALRITQTGTIATTKLFYMSFGTAAPSSQPDGGWATPSNYTDWGDSGEGVTDATSFSGDCTLRGNSVSSGYTDASGGTNAYLGWDKYFQISNVSVSGGNQMDITFGCAYYDGSSDNVFKPEYITVEASADGGSTWLPVTYTSATTENDRWYFSSGSVVMPVGTTNLDLRFKGALSSGQLRIDDVTIVAREAEEPTEPQVITGQASDVTSTTATLNGTYNFGTAATELGFEWKKSDEGDDAYQRVQGVGSVAFTAAVSGLSATTSYDYRAYAVVDGQTYYGEVKSFTSDAAGTVLLKESMGTEDVSSKPSVDSYAGWLKEGLGANGVTYTGVAADKVTVRTSSGGASKDYDGASGVNYVYFGSNQPNSFFVNGINAGGATHFSLTFGCNKYVYGASASDNVVTAADLQVFYSTTGTDDSYTQLTVPYSGIQGKWQLASVSFTTPAAAQNLWLKFTSHVNSAISIDDITLRTTDNVNIDPAPKVTTVTPATELGDNTATVGGSYTYTGSRTVDKVGVAYKKASDADFTEVDAAAVASSFTVALTGLTSGTTYDYKAYVKIGSDTYYGSEETFTTTGALSLLKISAIRAAAQNGEAVASGYIKAMVVSEASGKNLMSYQFVVEDGTEANSGIMINLAEQGATHTYVPGDMLNIKMTGVTYNIYNDLIQLKVPGANVEKLTETGTVTPVTITVDQMADYESMFVAIADAQVVVDDLSKKMGAGSINMETESGKRFVMYTKSSAAFADDLVPQKMGTAEGIVGNYKGTMQLQPRTMADLSGMNQERFGAPVEIAFGTAEFTATKGVANEALEGAYIEIPYTRASGSETYPNVVVTVTGAGMGTIPATINYNVASVTAGAGTIRIPVTGTPAAGEVNFSVAGISTEAIICSKTFTAAGIGEFSVIWNSYAFSDGGPSPWAPTSVTPENIVTVGGLTRNGFSVAGGSPGARNWNGANFSSNTADNPTQYASFTVSAAKTLSLSSLKFVQKSSGTGPKSVNVEYSLNGGTTYTLIQATTISGTSENIVDLSLSDVAALQNIAVGTTVTVRFVPFNASGTGNWNLTMKNNTQETGPFTMQLEGSTK